MYSNILVPLDSSKFAETVLPLVGSLARASNGKATFVMVGAPYVDEVIVHQRGGMSKWVKTLRDLKRRKFDAAIVLPRSFSAAFLACSHAAELLTAGGGAVVNMASVAAQIALPGRVAYSSAKASVVAFTRRSSI